MLLNTCTNIFLSSRNQIQKLFEEQFFLYKSQKYFKEHISTGIIKWTGFPKYWICYLLCSYFIPKQTSYHIESISDEANIVNSNQYTMLSSPMDHHVEKCISLIIWRPREAFNNHTGPILFPSYPVTNINQYGKYRGNPIRIFKLSQERWSVCGRATAARDGNG